VEELVFGKISTGALSDLQHVTKVASAMVTVYGMNDKIGNLSFYDPQNENGFTKPYSEETGKIIDTEIRKIIEQAYEKTKNLLSEKMDAVKVIAEELLRKEVLYKDDLERLIGKRPFEETATFTEDTTSPTSESNPAESQPDAGSQSENPADETPTA
jgi:AFG3 family protein